MNNDAFDIGQHLQEVDSSMFYRLTPQKQALIRHLKALSELMLEIGLAEHQGGTVPDEAEKITAVIGMQSVLTSTLIDADRAAKDLQKVLEEANCGRYGGRL